ncbi:MAG TPA: hypothetical protein VMU84_00180 [Thermoanaerobaculia bacterium]|nr:hypothetical protein [Thermoanaerobaculia bacterium]
MRSSLSVCALFLAAATNLHAQSNVGVEIDDLVDNRVSAGGFSGTLELRVKLKGTNLDRAAAARILVKEARDDRGNVLADPSSVPDFMAREYNSGTLNVSLKQPARAASSVKIKGTVELYVPARDPSALVKVDKALAKLDAPLASKALKDAKIEITPLSHDGYAAAMKARKITDKDIAMIREQGKAHGASDKDIETAIELAKAFESMDSDPPEGAVILSGKKADFDRIYRVEILGTDGKPIDVGSRSSSTRGESSIMTLQPSSPAPPGSTLQLSLLTQKSRVSFPFELSVTLP